MIRILLGFCLLIGSAGASDMNMEIIDCLIPALIGLVLAISGTVSVLRNEEID